MPAEKNIGKTGDKVKPDRTERTADSTAADSVIAGDRKYEHQALHQHMEKAGHNFESYTTKSIPEKRGDESDDAYRSRLEKLAEGANPLVLTDGGNVVYDGGSKLNQALERSKESSVPLDQPQNMESSQHLASLASDNPALKPVSLLRDYAQALPPGEEKERLIALSRQQASEVSPEMKAYYGMENSSSPEAAKTAGAIPESMPEGTVGKTDAGYKLDVVVRENVFVEETYDKDTGTSQDKIKLQNATGAILETARERFGKEGIDKLKIAPDDVGSSMTALLLGPDIFNAIGPEQAKSFGNRLLVFGVAPVFGMAQEAQKAIFENSEKTVEEGEVNFLAGTGIGVVLERAHPLMIAGLTLGFTGQFINDQLNSPENSARNLEILDMCSKLDASGPDELAQYSRRTKELLGPDLYKGAFGVVTGGIGIPKGHIISAETKAETEAITSAIKPQEILDNMSKLPQEVCDALAWLMGHEDTPQFAFANGGKIELPQTKDVLDDTNTMAMVGGNPFEWIKYLGKPALNPKLELTKAVEMAVETMVKPLPDVDMKKLSEALPDAEPRQIAERLQSRQEHFDTLVDALGKLKDPRDLLKLYEVGHRFHFVDLDEVGLGLGSQTAEIPQAPLVNRDQLPGFTTYKKVDGKAGVTVIPEHVRNIESGELIRTKDLPIPDVDGSLKPIRMDGLLRHEVGQALSQIHGWKNISVELPDGRLRSTNDLYHIGRQALIDRRERLGVELAEVYRNLEISGLSQADIFNQHEYMDLTNRHTLFDSHIAGNEIGLEQTLGDLWAIHQGGSSYSASFDADLTVYFEELYAFLSENNWFRR